MKTKRVMWAAWILGIVSSGALAQKATTAPQVAPPQGMVVPPGMVLTPQGMVVPQAGMPPGMMVPPGAMMMPPGYYAGAGATPRPEAPATKEQESASCVVELDLDGAEFYDQHTVSELLKSTVLQDLAVNKGLAVKGASAQQLFYITSNVSGTRAEIKVAPLASSEVKADGSKRVLFAMIDEANKVLDRTAKNKDEQLRAGRAQLMPQLAEAKKRLAEIDDKLATANNARNDNRYPWQNLNQQKDAAELDLAARRARLKALEAAAPATQPAMRGRDNAVSDLEALVQFREQKLAESRELLKQKQIMAGEVVQQEIALFELKQRMESYRRASVPGYAGNFGQTELPQLRVAIAEEEARLAAINAQLAKMKPPPAEALVQLTQEQIRSLTMERQEVERQVDRLNSQLARLDNTDNSKLPRKMIVMGEQ